MPPAQHSGEERLASATRPALVAAAVFFSIAYLSNLRTQADAFLNGFSGALVFGGACFLFARSACKNKVAFAWWQWPPYFAGALLGSISCLYWGVMYWLYRRNEPHLPFFNRAFHRRTYALGLVLLPLFVVAGVIDLLAPA